MLRIIEEIEDCPIIASVRDTQIDEAINSPVKMIFLLDANIMNIEVNIKKIHNSNKRAFVHLDLANGIGKDKAGVEFLSKLGVDGIISTKANIIHYAKEMGIATIQRFFALDSQGVSSIGDMIKSSRPDMIEIMPALATKVISKLSKVGALVIAGGLIEEKSEVLSALSSGAIAISTGKSDLWYI